MIRSLLLWMGEGDDPAMAGLDWIRRQIDLPDGTALGRLALALGALALPEIIRPHTRRENYHAA